MGSFGLLAQSLGLLLLLVLVNGQCPTGPEPGCQDAEVQAGNIHMVHETYCELFYQCNSGLTRFIQRCGPGTLFDGTLSVCVAPERAICPSWSCDASTQGRRYPALCNDEYYECSGSGYVKRNCTSGQTFDCNTQQCSTTIATKDHPLCARRGTGGASDYTCYDLEDQNGNPCVYTTKFASIEIKKRPCPYGTSFNATACQCSTLTNACPTINQTRYADVKVLDPECKASFKLDFDRLPLVSTSEKLLPPGSNVTLPYEFQTVGVTVIGGWGSFRSVPSTGSAACFYSYFLARSTLSCPWAIRIRLQLQNVGTTGQVQTTPITLVTSDYKSVCTATLTATLTYSNGRFTLDISATGATRTGVTTETRISGQTTGSIQMAGTNILDVILIFDCSTISAQLVDRGQNGNGNNCVNVPATIALGDYIATNRCGFTVGEGLNGRIDYFYIHEGCGDLSRARACSAQ